MLIFQFKDWTLWCDPAGVSSYRFRKQWDVLLRSCFLDVETRCLYVEHLNKTKIILMNFLSGIWGKSGHVFVPFKGAEYQTLYLIFDNTLYIYLQQQQQSASSRAAGWSSDCILEMSQISLLPPHLQTASIDLTFRQRTHGKSLHHQRHIWCMISVTRIRAHLLAVTKRCSPAVCVSGVQRRRNRHNLCVCEVHQLLLKCRELHPLRAGSREETVGVILSSWSPAADLRVKPNGLETPAGSTINDE